MPIAGRTTTYEPGRGIPPLARLYKGQARDEKRPNWTPPELPYFRLEWEAAYLRHAALFERMYGKEPAEIPGVMLMGDTPEVAFPNWMEQWAAGAKLVRRCTGETIVDQFNPETQRTQHGVNLSCPSTEAHPCECKQVGRLRFILPEFMKASGAVGSFTLVTHGWYDIGRIDATIKDVFALYGTLRGVPFVLFRQPTELPVAYRDLKSGEMKRTTKTFQMALLRVQDGYVNGTLALPLINDMPRLIDPETGELLGGATSSAPQLPAAVQTFTSEADWKAFHERMKQAYPQYATADFPADFVDVFGVDRASLMIGTLADAETKVETWVANRLAEDGYTYEAEQVLSGNSADTDELDRVFGKRPDPTTLGELYFVDEVRMQQGAGGKFSYVLICPDGTNIVLYTGEVFRQAGLNPDAWKQRGHVEKFDPALKVHAAKEGEKWVVYAVEVPMPQ